MAEFETVSMAEPTTMSFPNLLEAKSVMKNGKPTGDPKFSAGFEFEPTSADLARMKAAAAKVAKAKWPGRDLKELAFPFTDGNKLADKAKSKDKDREFSRGKVVLTARSKYRPRMSIFQGGKAVDLETDDAIKANIRQFYSGAQVLAQVAFNAYEGVGNNPDGVNAYLNVVLTLNRGNRLTGGATAAETFKDYVGSLSDIDPTVGVELDEEIPF